MCIGVDRKIFSGKSQYLTRNQMKAVTVSQTDFRKKVGRKRKQDCYLFIKVEENIYVTHHHSG